MQFHIISLLIVEINIFMEESLKARITQASIFFWHN